jgi:hypothetical protein
MTLLTLYLAGALVAAALAIWRPPRLPRYCLLLLIAAVPQLGGLVGIRIPGMFLVTAATILIWCLCNRRIGGIPLLTLGIFLNLVIMAWHGGAMPIHAATLAQIGDAVAPGTLLTGSKDIVVGSTPLALLSDWIVIPAWIMIVASPGDIIALLGIIWWLLLSHTEEKDQAMMMFRAVAAPLDAHTPLLPGQSARPALTRLALLVAANPTVAESLLNDPLAAASAHPHYAMLLDARDRATLAAIRARAHTVGEFLSDLADVVDGMPGWPEAAA